MARIYIRLARSSPKGKGRWEVMNGTRSVSRHVDKKKAHEKAHKLREKRAARTKKSKRRTR